MEDKFFYVILMYVMLEAARITITWTNIIPSKYYKNIIYVDFVTYKRK
jgi:hypothetical protein